MIIIGEFFIYFLNVNITDSPFHSRLAVDSYYVLSEYFWTELLPVITFQLMDTTAYF